MSGLLKLLGLNGLIHDNSDIADQSATSPANSPCVGNGFVGLHDPFCLRFRRLGGLWNNDISDITDQSGTISDIREQPGSWIGEVAELVTVVDESTMVRFLDDVSKLLSKANGPTTGREQLGSWIGEVAELVSDADESTMVKFLDDAPKLLSKADGPTTGSDANLKGRNARGSMVTDAGL